MNLRKDHYRFLCESLARRSSEPPPRGVPDSSLRLGPSGSVPQESIESNAAEREKGGVVVVRGDGAHRSVPQAGSVPGC